MRVTIKNDFHNTVYTINFPAGTDTYRMSDATAKRVQNALCGIKGCCGSHLGMRGHQDEVVINGKQYTPIDDSVFDTRSGLTIPLIALDN